MRYAVSNLSQKENLLFSNKQTNKGTNNKKIFFCRQAADEIFTYCPRIFLWFQVLEFSITDRRKNYLRNIIVNKCENVQSDLTLFQFFSSKAKVIVAKRWGTFVRILLSSGFL